VNPADYALWALWIGTFSARQDEYVVDSNRTIKEPLTPEVAQAAWDHQSSVSGFLSSLNPDTGKRVTHVAAIDVDTDWADVEKVCVMLASHGIRALVVRSRRGGHIWTWPVGDGSHDTTKHWPVPAATVRRALTAAVKLAVDDASKIEVFPKAGPSGGALRMPLFPHPKDNVLYPVIDGQAEVTDRLVAYHLTIDRTTPYEAFYALAGPPPDQTTMTPVPGPLRASTGLVLPSGPSVSALLQGLGISNAQPGHSVRCPWHEDKHASLSILADDQRAICKAPSCPANNGGRGVGSLALRRMLEGR
jgi:hypothetical protein